MASKNTLKKIQKRNGRIMPFDEAKIENAIWRAERAVSENDRKVARELTAVVIRQLKKKFIKRVPAVEDVQDIVENVLIEAGQAKIAKAYILYRQERASIRQEKKRILEKEEIDEVDKDFDVNALNVLKARYLKRDEKGRVVESPKELFTRVGVHVALPNLLYDRKIFDPAARQKTHKKELFQPAENEGRYAIGPYPLNRFHLEALKRMYDRANNEGKMKLTWTAFLKAVRAGEFKKHAAGMTRFINLMVKRQFMPNTPAIANYGGVLGMGSACFVLGVGDSMESIMDTLKATALIHKSGGGTGFNFSQLRPEGDYVSSTHGVASGPVSFMQIFDMMTEVVKQGGMRRGANMGILNSNHPDIEKFITAKEGNKALRNFNISVLLMPDFWEHYRENKPYPLVNPRTGEVVRKVNPRMLFDMIVYQAWESAEPGVIFFDHVNKYNPFYKHLGPIVTTNPCGEVLLYPNEACNLGSINVWAFAKEDDDGKINYDWDGLAEAVRAGTCLLDNVIDVNKWPLPEIEEMTLSTRKIGLGIMGLGDLLYELKIPYNSKEGLEFMEKIMEFVNYHSKQESIELAKTRGVFPYYKKSFYPEGRLPFAGADQSNKKQWRFDWDELKRRIKKYGIRNGYTNIIAPTGSISMIAGTTSGIEPVFSLVFEKNVAVGSFYYVDPVFKKVMEQEGLYDERLMEEVSANRGSVQNISYIPGKLKKTFVTAYDIKPEDHIRALAAFQKWVDSSISKTNNFPANATVDDMRKSYLLAYKLGCKDVTVYRDSSIKDQVLAMPKKKQTARKDNPVPKQEPTLAGAVREEEGSPVVTGSYAIDIQEDPTGKFCPQCSTRLVYQEGCVKCPACAWGLCSS